MDAVPEKFPVMIYIHGGNFVKGASNLFPGHIMATFYRVVVVTINYRLGALGKQFLKLALLVAYLGFYSIRIFKYG